MKKLSLFLYFCLVINITQIALGEPVTRIFINQIVSHPAFDATINGIIDELRDNNFIAGKNLELKIDSAQGSIPLANQIARKFVSNKPNVVVALGTVAAQSFIKYAKEDKIKLIFSSVTAPKEAGLIEKNISGVSNFIDLEPQLELFKKISPNLKKIGFLYNPGEANSLTLVKKLEDLCPKFGLSLISQIASSSTMVPESAIKLAQNCDAIFISNDSTALSAMPSIIKAATNANIPVYVSDIDIVKDGALAALGPNQYMIGRQTGKIIVRILNGEDINKIAMEFPTTTLLYVNSQAAAKLGIVFSEEILKNAFKVIEKNY